MQAKYISNKIKTLKKNHVYELYFSKKAKSYVYDCIVERDLTDDKSIGLYLQFASEISIKNYFDIKKLELEG